MFESRSLSHLARFYSTLPPTVLRTFITHRHTQQKLLSNKEQIELDNAISAKQFTFDRNPSRQLFKSEDDPTSVSGSLSKAEIYALTRSQRDNVEIVTPTNHLPKDVRLQYLYPPDHLNRMQLHPRAAKTYATGEYYNSHLRLASKPADPHPSYKSHPDTSTYRRATTGRRHIPFPARLRGDFRDEVYERIPMPIKDNRAKDGTEDNFPTNKTTTLPSATLFTPAPPSISITSQVPDAPIKSVHSIYHPNARTPVEFPASSLSTPPSYPTSLVDMPSLPLALSTGRGNSTQCLDPIPPLSLTARSFIPTNPIPLHSPAHEYTQTRIFPSTNDVKPLFESSSSSSPPNSNGGMGFADQAHSLYVASRGDQPLSQTLPTSYAAFAPTKYNHVPSFGRSGKFQAVPITKPDHGLHATSYRLW